MNCAPISNQPAARACGFASRVAIGCLLLFLGSAHAQPGESPAVPPGAQALLQAGREALRDVQRMRKAMPQEAELLQAVEQKGSQVTLRFHESLLDLEPGSAEFQALMRHVHTALNPLLRDSLDHIEFETRIGEYSLMEWLAVLAPADAPKRVQQPSVPAGLQSVSGRRIALSPGHGWYLDGSWKLQRSYFFGIVEDFINFDLVQLLHQRLQAEGAWLRPTRNMDKSAGNGESGNPRWQEAARYHIKSLGLPASVWDSSTSDLNDDIRARPLYANWNDGNGQNAEILVSLHNNGGGGTGTETLYDTANGFGSESKRLADAVHGRILSTIRANYNANWVDRRVQGFAGDYGENRLATRPAILIELAFMDRQSPDNAALQDPVFRELVVQAIKQGIADFFGGLQVDAVPPSAPTQLGGKAAGTNVVLLNWSGAADNVGVTGYRIERNGSVVGETTSTSWLDFNPPRDMPLQYRVAARDAAGNWSVYSQTTLALHLAGGYQPLVREAPGSTGKQADHAAIPAMEPR